MTCHLAPLTFFFGSNSHRFPLRRERQKKKRMEAESIAKNLDSIVLSELNGNDGNVQVKVKFPEHRYNSISLLFRMLFSSLYLENDMLIPEGSRNYDLDWTVQLLNRKLPAQVI
jgi:hypothetical protein